MRIPRLAQFVLTVLILAAAARAQKVDVGLDTDRRVATCFVADDEGITLAGVAIGYTTLPWREEYEATLQHLQMANYMRLGRGWWTTLDTIGAIEIAGTKVDPGSYCVGLAVAADGAFSLLLFDSRKTMAARLLPFTTALYTGAAKPDVRIPLTFAKDKSSDAVNLEIALAADAKHPSRGTFVIRWGKHELSAPVAFELVRPRPADSPK